MNAKIPVIAAALLIAIACATTPRNTQMSDADVQRLETAKWNPNSFASPQEFSALFAPDFVSIEYGSDVQGGAHRKTRAEVFSGPPLPPASFELSDWMFIHPRPGVVIASYHVKGLSFSWDAYATSIWAYRDGKWVTVFYQASTAQ